MANRPLAAEGADGGSRRLTSPGIASLAFTLNYCCSTLCRSHRLAHYAQGRKLRG